MKSVNLQLSWIRNALVLIALVVGVAACASRPASSTLPDIPVNIVFNESHCPVAVDPEKPVDVSKSAGQRIVWQAVNAGGKPIDERFRIYFDPFKGNPLRANSHGYKQSPKINAGSPVNVEYKYSIEGEKCEGDALDPRFRLN